MKPYYYVGDHTDHNARRFDLIQDAKDRAEALAGLHPGKSFEIVQVIGISSTPNPAVSTFWLDEAKNGEVETRDNVIRNLRKTLEEQERVIMSLERALEKEHNQG